MGGNTWLRDSDGVRRGKIIFDNNLWIIRISPNKGRVHAGVLIRHSFGNTSIKRNMAGGIRD